ncbi:MAG TPA: BTAD domain-containing putative transcriptional regulator [Anaerolineales bacterium]|nr:BTAD domain-containing putative transcriptional regulator [Anaerolineales bacterium]
MFLHTVLRTKIIPPPRGLRTLARPRVSQILKQAFDYRLTILQAGAGYGKSTALAELAGETQPVVWYQVSDEDNDPLVFLLHVCHAIQKALPGITDLPIAFLESWEGGQGPLPWRGILDQIINALSNHLVVPALLILDDAHHVTDTGEVPHLLDRLIGLAPANFHVLLSGRPTLTLPNLSRWRAKGEVLFLDQFALTFTTEEITALFVTHYNVELTTEEAEALLSYTEGWAIALQLIWQNLRAQPVPSLDFPSRWQAASLDALFDLLAREVFAGQSSDVREFLLITSTLRDLTPDVCDALRRTVGNLAGDSASMLAYLRRQDLFIVETAEGVMRYHHIFHNFLRQQSTFEQRQGWNRIAADYFSARNDPESAIYHLLEAQAWDAVADMLDIYSGNLLSMGRLDTLATYIDSLPPESLHGHPMLIFTLGDLARLHSRFDEALGWYKQAETLWRSRGQQDGVARALRGQARVYLDTVDPSKAEQLLEEAIRLSDGFEDREAQVRLFELLAENKLNYGRVEEAVRLRQRAEDLRLEGPTNDQLWFRVLLRTGRFNEARKGLEQRAEAEKAIPVQTPRAHRETLLLLSFIYVMQGEPELAYQAAVEGTRRGESLDSPFVSAVGYMRQGHAWMLLGNYRERDENFSKARQQYEKSIELSRMLAVPRLRVESGWGLCRSYGYAGDLTRALTHAQESIEIAAQAGDEWIASLIRLTMGASLTLAERYESAEQWLGKAIAGFQECSDPFGRSAARLWLSLGCFKRKQFDRLSQTLPEVLATCQANDYGFLFTRPSMLGALDERIFVPLIIHASQKGWEGSYAAQLLSEGLGLAGIEAHPGYQLRVDTLGGFQVWRGAEAIPSNGWRREKSKQLFQLLLTYRHSPLDRDQICEYLWPEADPMTAQRNFKITLNTLYQVLEPERDAGSESAFIFREGSTYGLRPNADLWLDAEEFSKAVKEAKGDPALLQQAMDLYKGEYLPDTLYETWAAEESERLSTLFLESADKLAEILVGKKRFNEAIDLCQRILGHDSCWERAYRHLMLAYDGLGDRGQIGRTYQRCVQTLRNELDVSPAPETQKLYEQLVRGG